MKLLKYGIIDLILFGLLNIGIDIMTAGLTVADIGLYPLIAIYVIRLVLSIIFISKSFDIFTLYTVYRHIVTYKSYRKTKGYFDVTDYYIETYLTLDSSNDFIVRGHVKSDNKPDMVLQTLDMVVPTLKQVIKNKIYVSINYSVYIILIDFIAHELLDENANVDVSNYAIKFTKVT